MDSENPRPVTLGNLEPIKTKDGVIRMIYASFWGTLFSLPVYAGFGDHWKLDKEDSEDISQASLDFVNSLPPAQRKVYQAFLNRWVPLVALLATVAIVAFSKYQTTLALRKDNSNGTIQPQQTEGRTADASTVQRVFAEPHSVSSFGSETSTNGREIIDDLLRRTD